jgi:hypothetical protein
MLSGKVEELADRIWARFAQCFEQPLDNRSQHFLGPDVEGGASEPRISPVKDCAAQAMEPSNSSVKQCADDRVGGSVAGQLVEIPLHRKAGAVVAHDGLANQGVADLPGFIVLALLSGRHA